MIEVKNLSKSFAQKPSLKNISFKVEQGEVISIIGHSGAGKSTLLHCLNRLIEPDSGEIIFEGQNILDRHFNVAKLRQEIGMVFQDFNLFKHLTVLENIMLAPMDLRKISRSKAYEEAMYFLSLVGMAEKASSYPAELSGGQKQRVAIARAWAMHPKVILFDEPTSALDPTMVGEVLAVIRNLSQQESLTMLIVTHQMQFAQEVSSRVIFLEQGQIYDDGTPKEIFLNPIKIKTKEFIWQMKSFHYKITSQKFDFYNLVNQLKNFGYRYLLSPKLSYNLQLVWEELGVQKILNQLPKQGFNLEITVYYAEKTQQCEFLFKYDGEKYNPLMESEDFSLFLVRKIIKDSFYSREGNLNNLQVILD